MIRFAVRRLASMLLVLFAVSVLVFLIFNAIPGGDPAARIAGEHVTPTQLAVIRREWGFDRSLPVQYAHTMEKLFGGKLVSYFTQVNVRDEIWKGLPRTLSLALGAALLWLAGGVGLGVLTAVRAGQDDRQGAERPRRHRRLHPRLLAGRGDEPLPRLRTGACSQTRGTCRSPTTRSGGRGTWHCAWLALTILFVGVYARVLQVAILEALHTDYVRTARAKGVSERQVILRHALRNALIPVVALWSLDFGVVIGAARSSSRRSSTSREWGSMPRPPWSSSICPRSWPCRCTAPSSS
jgi:peptide/nickel transport system permease protein